LQVSVSFLLVYKTGEEVVKKNNERGDSKNNMTDENNVKGVENQKGQKGKEQGIQEKAK